MAPRPPLLSPLMETVATTEGERVWFCLFPWLQHLAQGPGVGVWKPMWNEGSSFRLSQSQSLRMCRSPGPTTSLTLFLGPLPMFTVSSTCPYSGTYPKKLLSNPGLLLDSGGCAGSPCLLAQVPPWHLRAGCWSRGQGFGWAWMLLGCCLLPPVSSQC